MRLRLLFACIWACLSSDAFAQTSTFVFPVDTLIKTGPLNKRINVCLVPDGYRANEMAKFQTDAQSFINALLNISPFMQYRAYFNFFLIRIPSNQSGATHPGTASDETTAGGGQPIETKDTYFGSRFDSYGIHRLVTTTQFTRFTNVMATNLPSYDLAVMLVNSPFYGGSGGVPSIATSATSSNEIAIHEIGHTFVSLADEYWAGLQYANERPNMTQTINPTSVRWRNWLNTPGIGVFPHNSPGQSWYKPATGTCKMEYLGRAFCSVCREGFVNRMLDLVKPVDSAFPASGTVSLSQPTTFSLTVVRPNPNTLTIRWLMNDQLLATQTEQLTVNPATLLPGQTYQLTAQVLDSTQFVRSDNHPAVHRQTLSWTIQRTGCSLVQTLRAGDWNDPTLWSCGSLPTATDEVIVGHALTISVADASARKVVFQNGGIIRYLNQRRLLLRN